MKICCRCKVEKKLDEFCINLYAKDGLNYSCKECNSKSYKKWYYNNIEYNLERSKKCREENADYYREMNKKWREQNREYDSRRKIKWHADKLKRDQRFKIKQNLRSRLHTAFQHYTNTGKTKTSDEYGINYQVIIEHLGPCPGKREDYHIDHIIPLSAFDFDDPEQIKAAFAPENHRWCLVEENLSKYNSIDEQLIKEFNIGHLTGSINNG